MARLRLLKKSDLPEADADVFERDINLYGILAHSPNLARAIRGVGRFLNTQSRLDPRLRELVILQVSMLASAPYVYSHHAKIGLGKGLSQEDVKAVAKETAGRPSHLDELPRMALRAAREMTRDIAVSDETYRALAEHLDSPAMVELLALVGFYNCMSRITASVKLDVEDEYKPYLDEYPIDAGKPGKGGADG